MENGKLKFITNNGEFYCVNCGDRIPGEDVKKNASKCCKCKSFKNKVLVILLDLTQRFENYLINKL
jgi:Zn finger protein HypA/HybF involved in hydrogenase expression